MFESARAIAALNLYQLTQLANDISDANLESMPYAGGHDARWVLGHIAISGDFAASLFGLPSAAPEAWGKLFGGGSSGQTSAGPTKQELLSVIEKNHARIDTAAAAADSALMAKPHGLDFLKDTPLKTVGDVVEFLMTAHESYHIAQLSAIRAALGFKPLF